MHRSWMLAAAGAALLFVTSAQAEPVPDALRTELRSLAAEVKSIIDKRGGGVVAVGAFTGSADLQGHVGPQVQLVLTEELTGTGLTVSTKNFQFEVSGKYLPFKDTKENRLDLAENDKERKEAGNASGLNCVRLVALISRSNGQPLNEVPTGRLIFGSESVPGMLGTGMSGPPRQDPREISDQFAMAKQQPQVKTEGTVIKGQTGQFEIEVLVKKGDSYVARPVTSQESGPFVGLSPNDIYGVRLTNKASFEAAVNLRIDGVNCFAFSDSRSQYWILSPGQSFDVLGWHRSDTKTTEFKVVANFPETAAAKLKLQPSESIGLITASFSACWESDALRPKDEPKVQGRGTGFGNDITVKTESVSRTIGQVRDMLVVRYEK